MAGLVKKKIAVRSKKGKSYMRSVMVRVGDAAKRTMKNKHVRTALKVGATVGVAALAAHAARNHWGTIGGAALGLKNGAHSLKQRGDKSRSSHMWQSLTNGVQEGRKAQREHGTFMEHVRGALKVRKTRGGSFSPSDHAIQSR